MFCKKIFCFLKCFCFLIIVVYETMIYNKYSMTHWNSPWLTFKIYYISKILGKSLMPSAKTAVIGVDKTLILSCLLFEKLRGLFYHIFTCNGQCHCLKGCMKINPFNLIPRAKNFRRPAYFQYLMIFLNFLHFFCFSSWTENSSSLC